MCHSSAVQADDDTSELQEIAGSAADMKSTSSVSGEVFCPIGETGSVHLPVNKHDVVSRQQELEALPLGDSQRSEGSEIDLRCDNITIINE